MRRFRANNHRRSCLLSAVVLSGAIGVGCTAGLSERAAFERGLFASRAAHDLDVAAEALERARPLLIDRYHNRTRRELDASIGTTARALQERDALTPAAVEQLVREAVSRYDKLASRRAAEERWLVALASRVRSGGKNIEALLAAADEEKAAVTRVREQFLREDAPALIASMMPAPMAPSANDNATNPLEEDSHEPAE